MKKIVALLIAIIIIFYVINSVSAKENIVPDEAIRYRIVASSNSAYDQKYKNKIT